MEPGDTRTSASLPACTATSRLEQTYVRVAAGLDGGGRRSGARARAYEPGLHCGGDEQQGYWPDRLALGCPCMCLVEHSSLVVTEAPVRARRVSAIVWRAGSSSRSVCSTDLVWVQAHRWWRLSSSNIKGQKTPSGPISVVTTTTMAPRNRPTFPWTRVATIANEEPAALPPTRPMRRELPACMRLTTPTPGELRRWFRRSGSGSCCSSSGRSRVESWGAEVVKVRTTRKIFFVTEGNSCNQEGALLLFPGGVRGLCAACGAASPRSRAPTASRAMALRATLDLRASAAPPGRVAGRPGPALHDAQRPRTPRLSWPHRGIGPFAQVTTPAAG